ncbi:TerD family protein [uncultured Duncaniella sp.]|jgi:tellurium resistance protein TerD|uniref:TerD family protein n=1 Tax=uncultured Duncaniella sp. TaxID=2768039 RepID=UPI00272FF06D|nr:TerD family protein [uncultured Duncaniella sp.]
MAINLVKGQRVEIGLSKLIVEMGWKVNPNAKPPYDLDASTFLLRANGEIGVEEDFVFYGSCKTIDTPDGKRPVSNDGSVLGSVDDLGDDDDNTGEGNEEIEVDLSKTNALIDQIIFTASIYWEKGAPSEKYNFGQVRNAYILIKNAVSSEEICRYDLDEDFSTEKGVEFGRLYRRNGAWKFEAVGTSYADGLEPICRKYASKFM